MHSRHYKSPGQFCPVPVRAPYHYMHNVESPRATSVYTVNSASRRFPCSCQILTGYANTLVVSLSKILSLASRQTVCESNQIARKHVVNIIMNHDMASRLFKLALKVVCRCFLKISSKHFPCQTGTNTNIEGVASCLSPPRTCNVCMFSTIVHLMKSHHRLKATGWALLG